MPQRRQLTWTELRVGLFVLVGLSVLAAGIFYVTSVGGGPLSPKYRYHPSSGDAGPEFGRPLPPATHPKAQWISQYVMRAPDIAPHWVTFADGGRLAHQPYVFPRAQGGAVEPGHYSLEMVQLTSGARHGRKHYRRVVLASGSAPSIDRAASRSRPVLVPCCRAV